MTIAMMNLNGQSGLIGELLSLILTILVSVIKLKTFEVTQDGFLNICCRISVFWAIGLGFEHEHPSGHVWL